MIIPLKLEEGKLLSRPNRFIFEGIADGQHQRLHCPGTGIIGRINDFKNLPCLFSPAEDDNKRSTTGTVEAISLNDGKSWIGINQNRINKWMKQFLIQDSIPELISCKGSKVRREVTVGNSRLDFLIESPFSSTFLEIKTPIQDFMINPKMDFKRPSSGQFFNRLIRHFSTLTDLTKQGHRTILLICFMYDACLFNPPGRNQWNFPIVDAVQRARSAGVEFWQLNFEISHTALRITRLDRIFSE